MQEGQRMDGYCWRCDAWRDGTFSIGPYELEVKHGAPKRVVEGVMRATCDTCGAVIATHHVSAPLIKAEMQEANAGRIRRERSSVRIPQALADWAGKFLPRFNIAPTRIDALIQGFMLGFMRCDGTGQASYMAALQFMDTAALKPHPVKCNLNFSDRLWEHIEKLRMDLGIATTSDLLRRVIAVMMQNDQIEKASELIPTYPRSKTITIAKKLARVAHFDRDVEVVAMLVGT